MSISSALAYKYLDEVVTLYSLGLKPATCINLTRPGLGRTANLTWSGSSITTHPDTCKAIPRCALRVY